MEQPLMKSNKLTWINFETIEEEDTNCKAITKLLLNYLRLGALSVIGFTTVCLLPMMVAIALWIIVGGIGYALR
jgi:hypothetical protein